MTDKQIIYDDLEVSKCKYYNNGWCLLSESCDQIKYKSCHDMTLFDCYYKQLKSKEQECDMLNNIINEAKNSKLDLKSFLVGEAVQNEYEQQLDQLKAENDKLKQTLIEIKPILEFYANSKMGEEQPDRTYKIMLSGGYVMVYDPKPARQTLQKISEVEQWQIMK